MASAAAAVVARVARVAAAVARARGAASCTAMECVAANFEAGAGHSDTPCWKSLQAGWQPFLSTVLCDETWRRVMDYGT